MLFFYTVGALFTIGYLIAFDKTSLGKYIMSFFAVLLWPMYIGFVIGTFLQVVVAYMEVRAKNG